MGTTWEWLGHCQGIARESRVAKLFRVRRLAFAWALICATVQGATAQRLPFTVTIVDGDRAVFASLGLNYRGDPSASEVMYCVEAWTIVPDSDGTERAYIERIRQARVGSTMSIVDMGQLCTGPKGESLPVIHTHMDGNCQFSVADLVTIVARRAPFDGLQCGTRHFVWAFAWQVLAIANEVERSKFKEPAEKRPP
jgi:hypothetical protein